MQSIFVNKKAIFDVPATGLAVYETKGAK